MTTPVKKALRKAEMDYARFDRGRDREAKYYTVQRMAEAGYRPAEIADATGVSKTNINYIKAGKFDLHRLPSTVTKRDMSAKHATELEKMADNAIKLACMQREQDPQIIWDTLANLERTTLQKLTVILLAAMPMDRSKSELFGWVYDLGEVTE